MPERVGYQPQLLSPDRELVTPLDTFRGAEFVAASIISGAVLSNERSVLSGGGRALAITTSNVARIRMLNLELHNDEPGWIQVEFRDGGTAGGRVLGPYDLNPLTGLSKKAEELQGRYFTSSVHLQVLSGYAAQPLSNGIKVNVGYILEPRDFFE